jgi:hypothetical protein
MKSGNLCIAGMLMVMFSAVAWPQGYSATASGTVMKDGSPVDNVQVVLTSFETGKQFKTKTDKRGNYASTGMMVGTYTVQVLGSDGVVLYTFEGLRIRGESSAPLNIDLAHPEDSHGVAGDPGAKQPAKMNKEQQKAEAARVKAENDKLASMNDLIAKYQAATQSANWPEAEKALQQLVAADPNTTRWEFYQRLADVQDRNNEQASALRSLDKGIEIAQAIVSGKAPKDPRNPSPDPARAKAGIAKMLVAEGNIYAKLGSSDLAAPLFAQAALDNPSPALAYYNLCVTQFNSNKLDDAVNSCDKSLASDPGRAEAWFLKGAALYKSGKTDTNGVAVEALNKYLELAPNGQHADDAKSMLKAGTAK